MGRLSTTAGDECRALSSGDNGRMTGSALDIPPVICDGGRPLRPERWSPWRHGTWSYIVTVIGADGAPVEGATVDIGAAEVTTSSEWWVVRRDGEGMPFTLESLRDASVTVTFGASGANASALAEAFGFCWYDGRFHCHRGDRKPMRCPACNPRGYTPRLCIDGREYARRRRAR